MFQLTQFYAGGLRAEGSTSRHTYQKAIMTINAANTDVALDISNPTGTFWTAAQADPIYGPLAAGALATLQRIAGIATNLRQISGEVIFNYMKVASGPTGPQYSLAITNHLPALTFASGSAPTTLELTLEWNIQSTLEAITDSRGY